MRRILIASTALSLIAIPAHAQVAGVDIGGVVSGAVGGAVGTLGGDAGAVAGAAGAATVGGDALGGGGVVGGGGAIGGFGAADTIISTGTGSTSLPVTVVRSNFDTAALAGGVVRADKGSAGLGAGAAASLGAGAGIWLADPNTVNSVVGLAQRALNCSNPCSGGQAPGSGHSGLGLLGIGPLAATAQGLVVASARLRADADLVVGGPSASYARTHFVIGKGTPVFEIGGDRMGRVDQVMVDASGVIHQLSIKIGGNVALIPANYFHITSTGLNCLISEAGIRQIANQQALAGAFVAARADAAVNAAAGTGHGAGNAALAPSMLAVTGSLAAQIEAAAVIQKGMPIFAPGGTQIGTVNQLMTDAEGYVHQVQVRIHGKEAMVPANYFQPSGNGLLCIVGEDTIEQMAQQQRPCCGERG